LAPALAGGTSTPELLASSSRRSRIAGRLPTSARCKAWPSWTNHDGIKGGLEVGLSGQTVTLTGTTTANQAVEISVSTDANGGFFFLNVSPGVYQLHTDSVKDLMSNPVNATNPGAAPTFVVSADETVSQSLAFGGLSPQAISARQFLSTSTTADFSVIRPAGDSTTLVNQDDTGSQNPTDGNDNPTDGNDNPTDGNQGPTRQQKGGIEFIVNQEGSGVAATTGDQVSLRYTGRLASDNSVFDTNVNNGKPLFTFTLGSGQAIKGFDTGVDGMKVGEKRPLFTPSALGYGPDGTPRSNPPIPPNADLIFDVELISITPGA